MASEKFVSSTLSRKQFQNILHSFQQSSQQLGDDRNTIRIVNFQGEQLVVKSFKVPNLINKIAYRFFRKSKAARSYLNAQYLISHNIGTPAPVAYLEKFDETGFRNSYYLSEYVSHDFTYRELINDDELKNKEEILKQFTQFIYRMHEAGIYFLDNSPGNTLIKKNSDGYEFFLVDLNRMKFYNIPYRDRLKNFERLSPQRWMYEIMGAEYARLSNQDPATTIQYMWDYTTKFQHKFLLKKSRKKKLKSIFKSS
jgi:serine/threonine protein kinase